MYQSYKDIIEKLGEPVWYDDNGVPRYCDPDHKRSSNVYASEVAFVVVSCQYCLKEMIVEYNWSKHSIIGALTGSPFLPISTASSNLYLKDAPYHDCPGETMSVDVVGLVSMYKDGLEIILTEKERDDWIKR